MGSSGLHPRVGRIVLLPLPVLPRPTLGPASRHGCYCHGQFHRARRVDDLDEDAVVLDQASSQCLVALNHGEVVAIFPEGEVWKKREPPLGDFAPGVIYLHRKSGAPIVPIAVWVSERKWPRRRYVARFGQPVQIPESMDQDAGAAWLREQVLALYEEAKRGAER